MTEPFKMPIYDQLRSPKDLAKLSERELTSLAAELRELIIHWVSSTGGHLASNLGVIELTLALMTSFDFPKDRIIWDVGHQSYTYKLLTGRREGFKVLRQFGGMAGFPKREESVYDSFNTGHSSTSISAALGLARALAAQGDPSRVVAVIGDGAMTGGMVYEALNNLTSEDRLIIILNDNQMSIAPNVGGFSRHLEHLRVSNRYLKLKRHTRLNLPRVPAFGQGLFRGLNAGRNILKKLVVRQPHTLFDAFDIKYYGPLDGHNIPLIQEHLRAAQTLEGSVVIHVCTQKGKGYTHAEQHPENYHGVAPFVVEKGLETSKAPDRALSFPESLPYSGSFTNAFRDSLLALAKEDPKIVAICAAMEGGTGLKAFHEAYPNRFYDVGIAEQHAVTMAAGMAAGGLRPIAAIYSTFLQRALDQVIHDVCLQQLPVVFCLDRSGVVGEDGETHQGLYDLSFLQAVPYLTILAARDYLELHYMLSYALKQTRGPVAIRYGRGGSEMPIHDLDRAAFERTLQQIHQATDDPFEPEVLKEGTGTLILTWGNECGRVLKAVEKVQSTLEDYEPTVVDLRQLKPLPEAWILDQLREGYQKLLVVEEAVMGGGISERIAMLIAQHELPISFGAMNLGPDPVLQGKAATVLEAHGMQGDTLVEALTEHAELSQLRAIEAHWTSAVYGD